MTAIADGDAAANGGSPIVSYSLEWDSGSGGAGFTALVGEASPNVQLAQVATGLTTGASYQFRYRVQNLHGWSGYSAVLTAIAADPPSTPAQPVTTNTGNSVKVQWTEPYDGGSTITALQIELRASDGTTFAAQVLYCNGQSDATVRTQAYCVIPVSVLQASPYSLVQGDKVVARMLATNAVGSSSYSDDGILTGQSYAEIQSVPHKPPSAPSRGATTATTQIEVAVAALTGVETGGSPILSYHIEFDDGTSGAVWTELQGYSSNSLSLSVVRTGLTIGTAYQVRYRARNLYGWSSAYSDVATIWTVTEPGQVAAATVTAVIVGTSVQVNWVAPGDNGSALLRYEILFAESAAADAPYVEELGYCDGRGAAILAGAACTVPMSQFWLSTAASSLKYAQGDNIKLQVRAWNTIGAGPLSAVVVGPVVETVPEVPTLAPLRDEAGTTSSQVAVTMPEIVDGSHAAGAASISSYNLEWNAGSGTAFSEVVGETTESLVRTVTVSAGIVAGQTYAFRYRVKNVHGWSSAYSPEVQVVAAAKPSAPAAPTTSLVGSMVTVAWAAPPANGSPILSYVIELQSKDGAWHLETANCDGAAAAVISATSCTLPQSVLTDSAGNFKLERADLVVARVAAVNAIAVGDASPVNSVGAKIQTLPAAPSGLASGAGTSATQIELSWTALTTEAEIGGVVGEVSITSYHVEWDAGASAGPWAELAGLSSAYTATTFTTSPGDPAQVLTAGQTYRFRVRAQNAQGWGPYSTAFSILAAGPPAQMAMITVADNAGLASVRIQWTAPSSNGGALTAYEIQLLSSTAGVYHATAECDGSSATTMANLYCDVQMSTLRAAPYSLSQGDPIVAIARASNSMGWATLYSTPNAGLTVTVQQVPDTPLIAPLSIASGVSSLTVEMTAVAAGLEGGSAITSYNLQYDSGGLAGAGTPGPAGEEDFVSLIGEVPDNNLAQRVLSLSGLSANTVFTFRYRVKNKHGWSGFSPTTAILTAVAPSAMTAPSVSYATSPTSITVSWTAPYTGGSPITAFTILLQHGDDSSAYSAESSYCDGTSLAIVTARSCDIPLTTLRAAPFNLALDQQIIAKASATNAVGQGPESPLSADAVKI